MPLARAFVIALCFMFTCIGAALAADPSGTWLTKNGDARIRVARCGAAMCGTIAWLRQPLDPATRQPQTDTNNPDPSRRSRPIMGLTIFAMSLDGTGDYAGEIYDADDGHVYRGKLVRLNPNQLEVKGCFGAICGSEIWTLAGR